MPNYTDLFDISASGMRLERVRLETAALNIANAHTTSGSQGGAYRPMRVIATTAGVKDAFSRALGGVGVPQVVPTTAPPRMVFDPASPQADANGYVATPAVDPLIEMTNLMSAVRAYEANVKAIEAARTMALRALEIGGR
jgi:flagellar basal-body rod protein FlgC